MFTHNTLGSDLESPPSSEDTYLHSIIWGQIEGGAPVQILWNGSYYTVHSYRMYLHHATNEHGVHGDPEVAFSVDADARQALKMQRRRLRA